MEVLVSKQLILQRLFHPPPLPLGACPEASVPQVFFPSDPNALHADNEGVPNYTSSTTLNGILRPESSCCGTFPPVRLPPEDQRG